MTIEQKNKRDWLERGYYAEQKLHALYEKCKRDRERAECVTQRYDTVVGGKSDTLRNGTQELLNVLTDSIEEYEKYAEKYASIRREISSAINALCDPVLEAILIHRHVEYIPMERIAEIMNYSGRTINRKYKEGLDKLSINL